MKMLKRRLIFAVGTVILIPILFIGIFLTIRMKRMAFEQSLKEVQSEVLRVEGRMEELIMTIHSIQVMIMSDQQINQALLKKYENPLEVYEEYNKHNLLHKFELTYSYLGDIRIYTENPTLLNNLDIMQTDKEVKKEDWYKKAIELKGESFGKLYYDSITRKNYFMVCRSYYPDKVTESVIMILVDLEKMRKVIIGEPFNIYIMDSANQILVSPEYSMVGQNLYEQFGIWLSEPGKQEKNIIKEQEIEHKGELYQMTSKRINESHLLSPIYLLSVVPNEIMYASSNEVVLSGVLVIILSILGGFALILGISELLSYQEEQQFSLYQQQMRFAVLVNQVNPHFLFNALEAIRMKAHVNGDEEISTIVKRLGKLIRRNLEISQDMIPLKDELEFVKDYFYIQKFRFGDKISAYFDCEERYYNYAVLPLTIQPIVENAIIHGLEAIIDSGTIWIKVYVNGNKLIVQIRDSGKGMSKEEKEKLIESMNVPDSNKEYSKENRIGLLNIHQRLRIKFGKYYGLNFTDNHPQGLIVEVIMPLITMKSK